MAVMRAIETVSKEAKTEAEDDDVVEVVSFLTSTNTLGQGELFPSLENHAILSSSFPFVLVPFFPSRSKATNNWPRTTTGQV